MFKYRIGFPGCPSRPDVPWTEETILRLRSLGFNTIQLNIAWGPRPGDEPLNLEDVVDPAGVRGGRWQSLALRSSNDPSAIKTRRENLKHRLDLCRRLEIRTLFHFGAPYNMLADFGDTPPNCILDNAQIDYHSALLEAFNAQYPGVDDLLLYTYDQDAWLCSEFGDCPRCSGRPLHERAPQFVNHLASVWAEINPGGRLWWEPWEFSAGQVFKCIPKLNRATVGLMLHSNIAEVIATAPVDRWLKIAVNLARENGIPAIVEHFFGAATEEVEPHRHLVWPKVVLRALRDIARLKPDGIKEYYGLDPTKEDPNLRMTGIFLSDPAVSDDDALEKLAEPYSACAPDIIRFWTLSSDAMDMFPWNTSWFIREIGKGDPQHSMSAAFIRGQQAHTPSWESTRRTIFMKTDNHQPDAWLLEDVQLQCELAAEKLGDALRVGANLVHSVPTGLCSEFSEGLREMGEWKRLALSYAYHIRETNLTGIIRRRLEKKNDVPDFIVNELKAVLELDIANQGADEPCRSALALLNASLADFVKTYFVEGLDDKRSRGPFTVTSK